MAKTKRFHRWVTATAVALVLWLSVAGLAIAPSVTRDSTSVSTATSEGRLAVFDDVWQTINDRYYDTEFHGVDWVAQREKYRTQAAEARDELELYAVLRRLVISLKDAHTRVYAPEEKFDWQRPRFITVGFSVREVEGQLTVVSVEAGSEAELAGMRRGDTIVSIAGEAAETRLKERLKEQPDSSTPQAARLFAVSSLLNGQADSKVLVAWENARDVEHEASFTRRWFQRTPGLAINYQRGAAIISFDAFTHGIAIDFAHALTNQMDKLKQARGIIIDLRGNGGGDAQAMAEIASAFLPAATALGQFTDRHGNVSLKIDTGTAPLYTAQTGERTQAPLIVLTSERTSSAAEIFLNALKQANRVTIMGSQTCGCVLAVRTHHALPDGG